MVSNIVTSPITTALGTAVAVGGSILGHPDLALSVGIAIMTQNDEQAWKR